MKTALTLTGAQVKNTSTDY